MAEEYDVRTKQLTRRAWRNKSNIHKDPNHWETELGEEIPSSTANVFTSMMRESSNSPYVIKKMEKEFIEWRIRNLSYPLDNYLLDFNEEGKVIYKVRFTAENPATVFGVPQFNMQNR
uniref:Protein DPCD n=1 Tax=Cacopsylla melanoneura TaxID=428564 RepID=A0A8D8ZA42_9HEMI